MHLRVFNKGNVVDNIEGQDTKIMDDDTKLKIINDTALEKLQAGIDLHIQLNIQVILKILSYVNSCTSVPYQGNIIQMDIEIYQISINLLVYQS